MVSVDLITAVIAVVIAAGGTVSMMWIYFKTKLHAFREFVDVLDDALYDDKVTDDEYKTLWSKFIKLVRNS